MQSSRRSGFTKLDREPEEIEYEVEDWERAGEATPEKPASCRKPVYIPYISDSNQDPSGRGT